jgi:hypothetical protein
MGDEDMQGATRHRIHVHIQYCREGRTGQDGAGRIHYTTYGGIRHIHHVQILQKRSPNLAQQAGSSKQHEQAKSKPASPCRVYTVVYILYCTMTKTTQEMTNKRIGHLPVLQSSSPDGEMGSWVAVAVAVAAGYLDTAYSITLYQSLLSYSHACRELPATSYQKQKVIGSEA